MKTGSSLTQIAQELERQLESRKDFIAKQSMVSMDVAHTAIPDTKEGEQVSRIVVKGINGSTLAVTKHAHHQFADHLGIPTKYYDRMVQEDPELLSHNVNVWLKKSPEERRMVRVLDGNVRAFLSDRFRPLDNYDLMKVSLPALQEAKAQVVSAEVTEKRLYVKAIFPELSGEVAEGLQLGQGHNFLSKDVVVASVTISNSEVGAGSLRVEAGCYKTRCTNLAIFADAAMRKFHIGRSAVAELDSAVEYFTDETRRADDQAFWMKVRDIVRASCNKDVFQAQLEKMKRAAGERIESENIPAVIEVTRKKLGLSDGLQNSLLKHLIEGQDLTRWGLLNAITRTAEDMKSYDDATDLERAGGKILELNPGDWRAITQAK